MTQLAALIGIVLIVLAIPFGLMLAPLALGVVIVWLVLRHVGGAVERPMGEPA
jgi:ABC-type siderophore export system fused ATPase/permease subunit